MAYRISSSPQCLKYFTDINSLEAQQCRDRTVIYKQLPSNLSTILNDPQLTSETVFVSYPVIFLKRYWKMVKSHYRQETHLQYSIVSQKLPGLEWTVVRYGRTIPPMFTKLEYNCIKEDIKSSCLTNTCLSIVQRSGKATTNLQLHLQFSRQRMYQFPREQHHKESTFGVIPSLCPVLRPIDPSFQCSAK